MAYDKSHHRFVVSDGSSRLSFFAIPTQASETDGNVDLESLVKIGEVVVVQKDSGTTSSRGQSQGQGQGEAEVKLLNELEMAPDNLHIYANIWFQNDIVKIELATGRVVGTVRLPRLYPRRERLPTAGEPPPLDLLL